MNVILVPRDLTRFEHCTSPSKELPMGFSLISWTNMLLACLRYKYVAGMQAMCARTLLQLVPDAQMVAWFTGDGRNPCGDLQLEDFVVDLSEWVYGSQKRSTVKTVDTVW